MIEITTIGAGGGSIARVDAGGLLQVGPESAGSRPGEVCYGAGNRRPTLTDAHLVLGRINAARPIGGALTRDRNGVAGVGRGMSRILPARTQYEASVPLVIVGAGAAGLVAALAAKAEGMAPLVLERDKVPRGSTSLSAGLVPAAETRWQRAAGIEDTPGQFAADIMSKADGLPDPDAVASVTEAVGPALEWLADAHGFEFSVITDFRYPGHSALRMHGLPSRSGGELIDRLREAVERQEIDLLTDAHVVSLHATHDGRITGLTLRRPDGTEAEIGCGALILACNGYGGARNLVGRHIPSLADAPYFGHPGNQGDALLWGEALGAATRDLSGHQGHGSIAHPARAFSDQVESPDRK